MGVHHLVICCVLFTTAVRSSVLDTVPGKANANLPQNANNQDCNCENGKCVTDNRGNSKCVCKPGYALQGEFTCKPCDCGSLGKCIFILALASSTPDVQHKYEKKCVCDVGTAEKDGVCVDCFCGSNSACDFDQGERRCYCIEGYSEKDGVCTKCDCGFNGECEYVNGNKKCECDEGYLELGGVCEECDCGSNSENCEFVDDVKRCKCKDKYAGRNGTCEECSCGDYTKSCHFEENMKTCSCLEGYVQKGDTCQLACSRENLCQNGGFCNEGFCLCLTGTSGEFCEEIDECSDLCPKHGDVHCAYDTSSHKAFCKCQDNNLSYDPNTKKCKRTCQDDSSCKNQGKCTGTSNDKFCDCLEGTAGDFCEEIPVCKSVDCGSDAYCAYNPSTKSALCACKDSKLNYDSNKRKCRKFCEKDKECDNGGKCSGKGNNKFCDCLPGTQGDKCEIIDDCASDRIKCNGKGTVCVYDVKNKKASCQCKDKDKEYDSLSGKCRRGCDKDKECDNGAKCRYIGSSKFCECLRGTQGDRCEIIDDCASGRIKCRGDRVYCDFDTKYLKAQCRCKDKGKEYDARNGRCRRRHNHHHSSESSSQESSEGFLDYFLDSD